MLLGAALSLEEATCWQGREPPPPRQSSSAWEDPPQGTQIGSPPGSWMEGLGSVQGPMRRGECLSPAPPLPLLQVLGVGRAGFRDPPRY